MAPPRKSDKNKEWCKAYRMKNRETYREKDAERKRLSRLKEKC